MKAINGALLATVVCALSVEVASAQSSRSPMPKSWAKTYGSPSPYEGLYDLRRAADGSIRVAAFSSTPGGAAAGWLMNIDRANGDVRSQGLVSNTLGGVTDGAGLAADGGALFTGRLVLDLYTKHDAWLVRVDGSGTPVWWRGFTRPGSGRHFLYDAVELDNGSWVAAGATSLNDQPPQRGWIVRLTPGGIIDWQYEYGAGIWEHIQSVDATSDGGVVVAGWTNSSGAGSDDAWIMKVDASGGISWQTTIGSSEIDQAASIVELQGGGYAVAGHTRSFTTSGYAPWALRLDAQGVLLWHAVTDGVWGDLQSIAETSTGGLIALGRVGEAGFPTNDLWAVEFGPNGDLRWQCAYAGDSGDWGSVVLPLGGSRLLLGGVWGWGFPEEDLWLLRTEPAGLLPGCDLVRGTSFPIISPKVLEQPGVAVRQAAGAIDRPVDFDSSTIDADAVERCR